MDYLYIRAWGQSLGSTNIFIEEEVRKARKDHAPETAIYHRQDGTWATFEEIDSEKTKEYIASIVVRLREQIEQDSKNV
jgi:hypothetical protein